MMFQRLGSGQKGDRRAQMFVFVVFLAANLLSGPALAQVGETTPNLSVNPQDRTIATENFLLTWNTGVNTEAITTLEWPLGAANLTSTYLLDTCGNIGDGGNVEYFGNSYAPPDPQSGGLVLVGAGTVTPAGKKPWSAQILDSGALQVTIYSSSVSCPPSSAGVAVKTSYEFPSPHDRSNWFGVERQFDFSAANFPYDFRPYMPRLSLQEGYTQVLYPTPAGALGTYEVASCQPGCTGPRSAPGADPLVPLWDSARGWFAIHNPTTLEGVIVSRNPASHEANTAQLWIDQDNGSNTNVSSFLLISPAGGFSGLVTEVERLCFYDSSTWTPSLVPPLACRN